MTALPDRLLIVVEPEAASPDRLLRLADAGARWFWLRAKHLTLDETGLLLRRLREPLAAAGAVLSLGVPAERAAALGQRAVHLPGDAESGAARRLLGPGSLIGRSAHSLEQVAAAAAAGLDYATLSPLFASASKPGYGPQLGLGALREAARLPLPLVGLGGVTPERAADCLRAGAAAVAVLGAFAQATEPLDVLARFRLAMASQ